MKAQAQINIEKCDACEDSKCQECYACPACDDCCTFTGCICQAPKPQAYTPGHYDDCPAR